MNEVDFQTAIPELDPLAVSQPVYSFGFRMKDHIVRSVPCAKFVQVDSDAWSILFEGGADGLCLARNGITAQVALPPSPLSNNYIEIQGAWQPKELMLTVHGSVTNQTRVPTPETFPPAAVHRWARAAVMQQYLPPYESSRELMGSVAGVLFHLMERIEILNLYQPFWNTASGKAPVPKAEPEVQPTLHAMMLDDADFRELSVERESVHGTGEVDFLFCGSVAGHPENVCVEFKLAHSKNLKHAIREQLPSYMRQRYTDLGILVVLWYKGADWEQPRNYNCIENLIADLLQETLKVRRKVPINVFGIELSKRPPPSCSQRRGSTVPTKIDTVSQWRNTMESADRVEEKKARLVSEVAQNYMGEYIRCHKSVPSRDTFIEWCLKLQRLSEKELQKLRSDMTGIEKFLE